MLRKILAVDDSALIHQMYKLFLSRYKNCKLVSAMNGLEALDKLAAGGLPIPVDRIVTASSAAICRSRPVRSARGKNKFRRTTAVGLRDLPR